MTAKKAAKKTPKKTKSTPAPIPVLSRAKALYLLRAVANSTADDDKRRYSEINSMVRSLDHAECGASWPLSHGWRNPKLWVELKLNDAQKARLKAVYDAHPSEEGESC